MLPALIAAVSVATTPSAAAPPPAPSATEATRFAIDAARRGTAPRRLARPSAAAHQQVAKRFRAAGLRTGFERFAVPGKGTSRDVIGIRDTPARCLVIVMAHADTVPPAPGADDNASGVGTLVALAPALAQGRAPECDTWLVATGSEERPYTRQPDHLGARALVNRLRRTHRLADVRLALSLDEVGRGTRFELRSPVPRPRASVETPILEAAQSSARRRHLAAETARPATPTTASSRSPGAPAAKLGVPDEPLRHTAQDTPDRLQRGAFARVLRVVWPLLRERQLTESIRSARRSASAIVLRFVFARGIDGMIEASATDRPSHPSTRPSPSTTAPIAHVPTGWKKPARGLAHVALGLDLRARAHLARRVGAHLLGGRHPPQRLDALDQHGDVALVGEEAVVDGQRRARVGRGQADASPATTASSRRRRRCPR